MEATKQKQSHSSDDFATKQSIRIGKLDACIKIIKRHTDFMGHPEYTIDQIKEVIKEYEDWLLK